MNQFESFQEVMESFQDMKSSSLFGGMIKYDDKNVAEEFFGDEQVDDKTISEGVRMFRHKEEEIRNFVKNVGQNPNFTEVQRDFAVASARTALLQIAYFKKSIYLEAAKAGFFLSKKRKKQYLEQVNDLQDQVYGPEISEVPEEKQKVLEAILALFQENAVRLDDTQKETMQQFFQKFAVEPQSSSTVQGDQMLDSRGQKGMTLRNTFLSEEDFVSIMRLTLDLYGLEDWGVSVNDKATMFSVKASKKIVEVPKAKIASTSLFRLLQLLDHEIGVHAVRWKNTNETLRVAGTNYLEGEEGLATHSEMMFDGNIDEIFGEITPHHIYTFIAENYDAPDTQKILEAIFTLQGSKNPKKEAHARMLRVKRFVSFDFPGANRKDTAYTRGNREISQKLATMAPEERKTFLKNFYYAKLSLGDQKFVEEFRRVFPDDHHTYPIWVGKILYKKLLGDKIFAEELAREDGRYAIDSVSRETKRKVVALLQKVRSVQ